MKEKIIYFIKSIFFISFLIFPSLVQAQEQEETSLSLSEKLMYNTVRIECKYKDNKTGIGTGFFFRFPGRSKNESIPVIITNRHVVQDSVEGSFFITIPSKKIEEKISEEIQKQIPQHLKLNFGNFEDQWIPHPENDVDLCILPIAQIHQIADMLGRVLKYQYISNKNIPTEKELSELTALEDVIMIGYPIGLWDEKNDLPIIRSGRTATHANIDYNGKEEFLIDAAVFPGSSGSPVYIFERGIKYKKSGTDIGKGRFFLLGVAYAIPKYTSKAKIEIIDIPTDINTSDKIPIPTNLGYVIKAKKILDFKRVLKK